MRKLVIAIFVLVIFFNFSDVMARTMNQANPADFSVGGVLVKMIGTKINLGMHTYQVSFENKTGSHLETIQVRDVDSRDKSPENTLKDKVGRLIEAQESGVSKHELRAKESDLAKLTLFGLTFTDEMILVPHFGIKHESVELPINVDTASIIVELNLISNASEKNESYMYAIVNIVDYDGSMTELSCTDRNEKGFVDCLVSNN
ncbi:MAG: hypothetical protein RLZZ230_535 [Candidatus Parcubacteria bacterium]